VAAQEQNPIQEVFGLLRRRAVQILAPAVVFGSIGWAFAQLWPRTYQAQTNLEVREVSPPVNGFGVDAKIIQRDIDNSRWQIMQFERVNRVIEKLEWREFKELTDPMEKVEFVRGVIKKIKVNVSGGGKSGQGGSTLIVMTYEDNDPQRAEQFLNQLREVFTSEVLDRYRTDSRKSLDLLRNQLAVAEEAAAAADAAAAKLKKDTGVSATQQAPGGGRQRDEDPVFKRLDRATSDLYDAESQVSAKTALIEQLKKVYEATPLEVPESLVRGGLGFDAELRDVEKAIADQRARQVGLLPAHHDFRDAELKIRKLETKKEELIQASVAPETSVNMVANPERADLQRQIRDAETALTQAKALKARLESDVQALRVESQGRVEIYRQLQDLDRQAAIAGAEYERAARAYAGQKAFVGWISSAFANPFEISELARAPKAPISPSGGVFLGGALILGLAIGLASAVLGEFGRNGVRGPADTARITGAPVLGVVNSIRTRKERRERSTQRFAAIVSTLAIASAVIWTTWAYQNEPQSLGSSLRTAIDRFRDSLR